MIWKKQPVGSKLSDLQNNKASKDTATQSAAGLMSASDKTKLDGIATGATAVSVVNNLNSDSTTSALSAAQGKALNRKTAYDWNSFTNYVSSLESEANGILLRFGTMRTISFQGVVRTHTEDEVLATLPEADRPTASAIFASGNVGASSVVIRINTNGQITLYSLNGVTASGRIYFNASYAVG